MHRRKHSGGDADEDEKTDVPSPLLGDSPVIHRHSSSAPNGRPIQNGSSYAPKSPRLDTTPPPRSRVSSNPGASMYRGVSPMSNGSRSPTASPANLRPLYSQPPPLRQSTYPDHPATASPFRSSFAFNTIPESGEAITTLTNGYVPQKHLRHSRSQSGVAYLGQYSPQYETSPSSSGSPSSPPPKSPRLSTPHSPLIPFEDASSASRHAHRHSRIHSRNLSVFFPRPGAQQQQDAIAEDGAQEIDYPGPGDTLIDGGVNSGLGIGFKFGVPNPELMPPLSPRPNGGGPKRRGHHHKHSVSHNFFSFMDPTAFQQQQGNGGPTPSQLNSPSLGGMHTLPTPSTTHFPASSMQHTFVTPAPGSTSADIESKRAGSALSSASWSVQAQVCAAAQFVLGAWMWVEGQRQGSLACTGLGYWVVFDAVGVYMGYYGEKLRREARSMKRAYGSRRVETVALFAQAIYLIFASVYVCKEAFEHVLLSSEGGAPDAGDAHHHHSPVETSPDHQGLQYPVTLLWICLITLISSGSVFSNHDRLVDATGNHLPTPLSFVKTLMAITKSPNRTATKPSSSVLARLLANPFTVLPSLFATSILGFAILLPPSQHHAADIGLACVETITTFMVAYPAAVALGKVLLQTAPTRGLPGGQMESFLRVMRELEHHHHIVHLPAPHLWQLTPVPPQVTSDHHDRLASSEEGSLVATVQLHVRKDLDDADVLKLTSEVWERCTRALGISGAGVTVSVVRG